jgi:hypothetical protein
LEELEQIFEALLSKREATSFQWRKLREAALISLKDRFKSAETATFLIKGNLKFKVIL